MNYTDGTFHAGLVGLLDLDTVNRPIYRTYLASPMTDVPARRLRMTRRARETTSNVLRKTKAADYDVYDPAENTHIGSPHSPMEVLQINRLEIVTSDLFVLILTFPAIGAGIELNIAVDAKVPILICHHADLRVSRMALAEPGVHLSSIPFRTISELRRKLTKAMPTVARKTIEQKIRRNQLYSQGGFTSFRRLIVRGRIQRRQTRSDFAAQCRINAEWLSSIETHDEVIASLSGTHVQDILRVLGVGAKLLPGVGLVVSDNELPGEIATVHIDLQHAWRQSLESMVDFVIEDQPKHDGCVIELWQSYDETVRQAIAGRNSLAEPISTEDWRREYRSRSSGRLC